MTTIKFDHLQSFVLCDLNCDQSGEDFIGKHTGLEKLISVTGVELHDKTMNQKEFPFKDCPYMKVLGLTEDGNKHLLWDFKNDKWIYRQYGSHTCAPCSYEIRAQRQRA